MSKDVLSNVFIFFTFHYLKTLSFNAIMLLLCFLSLKCILSFLPILFTEYDLFKSDTHNSALHSSVPERVPAQMARKAFDKEIFNEMPRFLGEQVDVSLKPLEPLSAMNHRNYKLITLQLKWVVLASEGFNVNASRLLSPFSSWYFIENVTMKGPMQTIQANLAFWLPAFMFARGL